MDRETILRAMKKRKRIDAVIDWCIDRIRIVDVIYDAINTLCDKRYNRIEYTDKKTKQYIDKALMKLLREEDINKKQIVIAYNLIGISLNEKAQYYFTKYREQIQQFLLNLYEINGYTKNVLNWTEDYVNKDTHFMIEIPLYMNHSKVITFSPKKY